MKSPEVKGRWRKMRLRGQDRVVVALAYQEFITVMI